MTTAPLPPGLARNSRLDRWVEIRTDGVVEVRTGKVEIGQGITSALAQIAAEELDVDYARIRMIPADTGRSAPPPSMVDRLPAVTPSFGLRPVSAGIMRMRP